MKSPLMIFKTKVVLIESANSMSLVERQHEPIRREFKIMKSDAPEDDEAMLQCSAKSVNGTVGPNGLIPTLIQYGALSRLGQANTINAIESYLCTERHRFDVTLFFEEFLEM